MGWRSVLRPFFKRQRGREINPDEVLLDASNLPQFNDGLFEGRIARSLGKHTFFYFGAVVFIAFMIFSGRIFMLQIVEGSAYAEESERNRLDHSVLFAERGVLYDRLGTEIAWNSVLPDEPYAKRTYLENAGVAHVLGYVGYPLKDANDQYYEEGYTPRSGVELAFNNRIDGENGLKIIETNALGDILSESTISTPRSGGDMTLSIDARISAKLYQLLQARAKDSGFSGGAGIIMDVETGELIALSSFPEYNANVLTEEGTTTIATYLSDERKPFLNRALSGLYAPGSIIKPFIALAALEEGVITPEKEILSTGQLVIPNPYFPDQPSIFRDWKAHGYVDMRHAIAMSSDVYFYEVGGGFEDQQGLGIENIEKYVRLFGFGEASGIDFGSEALGTIPNPKWKEEHFPDEPWRLGNTYHTAIGQFGFQITPIQAVRATAALANGGILVEPTIVKTDHPQGIEVLPIDEENLRVVREGMRLAVTEGTAAGLSVPYVSIAGKTGTAEIGVKKDFVNSWVIGFFPYEKPKYAFVVMMERGPVHNLLGGVWVMRQLLDWMHMNTPEYFEG